MTDPLAPFEDYETRVVARVTEVCGERPPEGTPLAELRDFVRQTLGKHPAGFNVEALLAHKSNWVPQGVARDADALEAFCRAHQPEEVFADRDLTLRLYLKLGALFFDLGYRYSADPIKAAGDVHAGLMFLEWYRMHASVKEVWKLIDGALLVVDSWVGLWFRIGCPRVSLRREEAAALALTDCSADLFLERDAPAPWPQFMVSVPDGALWISDSSVERQVDRIMMHRFETGDGGHVWLVLVGCGATLFVAPCLRAVDLEDLLDEERQAKRAGLFSRVSHTDKGRAPIDALALRGLQAAARMAAGVCLALNDRQVAGDKKIGRAVPTSRVGGVPRTTDFKLGLPIDVDFSEPLREYTLGHRTQARKSQWVVRGHWRQQAVGKGRAQRRTTWIKPFWKGPASATILLREHRLGKEHGHGE